MLGAVQNMSGLLGGVMYNAIYPLTLKVWHGTVFAIGAGVAIIPFILAWYVYKQYWQVQLNQHQHHYKIVMNSFISNCSDNIYRNFIPIFNFNNVYITR